MPARLCAKCEERWPIVAGLKDCPACGGPTTHSASREPTISPEDTLSIQLHRQFDEFYERRERDRDLRGEVTPEQIGYLDARREIAAGTRS